MKYLIFIYVQYMYVSYVYENIFSRALYEFNEHSVYLKKKKGEDQLWIQAH